MALLLTVRQAADELGISRANVYNRMASGEIRSVHIGALRRIPREALEEYVASLAEQAAASRQRGGGA
jgi:excisionase family DNA binding protein